MNPFALPEIWRFENYVKVWQKGGFDKYFLNSIFVTVIAMFFLFCYLEVWLPMV